MAEKDKCIASIKSLADKLGFTEQEVSHIVDNIESEKIQAANDRPFNSEEQSFDQAAKRVEDEILRVSLKRKRDAARQLETNLKMFDKIKTNFKDNNFSWGLKNQMVGVTGNVVGSKKSVGHLSDALEGRYINTLGSALDKEELLKPMRNRKFDEEIYAAAFESISRQDRNVKISDPARKSFEIINEIKQMSRRNENEAGGDIGELPEHMFQTWDKERLLQTPSGRLTDRATAKREFVTLLKSWGHWMRNIGTLDEAKIDEFANSFYDSMITGVNLKTLGATNKSGFLGKVGRSADQSRIFHFANSEGAFMANQMYGRGGVLDSVMSNLRLSARNTVLMNNFGPNVAQGFKAVNEMLIIENRKRLSSKLDTRKLQESEKAWDKALADDKYLSNLNTQLKTVMQSAGGRRKRKQLEKEIALRIKENPKLRSLKAARDKTVDAAGPLIKALEKDIALLKSQKWFSNIPGFTLDNIFKHLTGELQTGAASRVGILANKIRAIMSMADLGMTTITAFGDLGTMYKEARAGGDDKFFSAPVEGLKRIARGIKTVEVKEGSDIGKIPFFDVNAKTPFSLAGEPFGNMNSTERQVLSMIGGATEHLSAAPGMRMTGDDVQTGDMAKKQAAFFKMNFLQPWTDTVRATSQLVFSEGLAFRRDKSYDELVKDGDRVIEVLREFGITPARWDLIRKSTMWHPGDGRVYTIPENIQNADRLDIERTMASEAQDKVVLDIERLNSGIKRRKKELAEIDSIKLKNQRKEVLQGLAKDKTQLAQLKQQSRKINKTKQPEEFEKLNKQAIVLNDRIKLTEKRLLKESRKRETLTESIKKNNALLEKLDVRQRELVKFRGDLDSGQLAAKTFFDDKRSIFRDADVKKFLDEVELDMNNYIIGRSERAVLAPSADTMAAVKMGRPSDTPEGIALRFLFQYKTFSFGMTRDILAKDFLGGLPPGTPLFSKATFKHHVGQMKQDFRGASMMDMARFIVYMTLLGYITKSTKDILAGRKPKDMSDPNVWLASLMQSGGAGIYGDLLFGPQSRFGNSPLVTVMGPGAARMEDALKLIYAGRDTALGKENVDFAAHVVRVAKRNTPFINLFYLKPAFDYLLIYQMQEAMNPGYLKRMEKRMKDMDDTEFFLPPSEVVK